MGRRWTMVTALGVLLPGLAAHGAMVVEKRVLDFGAVEQGTVVERQFAVWNTGRSQVRIERTQSSCGCTAAAAEGRLVQPREVILVNVRLDTAALSGKTTKIVTLHTSDPQTREVQLALIGTVLTDLVVTPTPIYLGRVYRGDSARRELRISAGRPAGATAYSASAVETESSALRAWLEPGDKPGEQKVVVELDVQAPSGRFDDYLLIRTNSPRQPEIRVQVFGNVLG